MPSQPFISKRYSFTYALYAVLCAIFFIYPPSFLQEAPWVALLFMSYFIIVALMRYLKPLVALTDQEIQVQLHPFFSQRSIAFEKIVKLEVKARVLIIEFITDFHNSNPNLPNRFTVIPLHPLSADQKKELVATLQEKCTKATIVEA